MKYRLEVDANTAVETVIVDGTEYKRNCKRIPTGIEYGEEFSAILEKANLEDWELDKVWDVLDSDFFVSDVMNLCAEVQT